MDWRRLLGRRDRHAEARDEIETHIRMAARDRIDRGQRPDEAERQARLELGSVRAAIDDSREVWSWTAIEQFWMDARNGARILTHAPALSLTAILLIALVVGGNTTIYSAVHGMLAKPAPGVSPEGLVSIGWRVDNGQIIQPSTTLAHYEGIAAESRTLQAAAFATWQLALTDQSGTFPVRGESVSTNYFDTLGVRLAHGRSFSEREAALGDNGLVAVISESLWWRQFGSAPDTVGRAIKISGRPATIIGIVPAPFHGAWTAEGTDIWMPLVAYARATGEEQNLRSSPAIDAIVGRLRHGASIDDADAEVKAIAQAIRATQKPGAPQYEPHAVAYTGIAARNNQIARYGPRFLAIFSVVTLLTVAIVCANVANLMLARAVERQREMAVRQSFGASRWRIVRIILAEGLTLSIAAWALACLFAYWVSRALPGIIPPSETGNLQVLLDFTPDWNVLGYAMLLALAATVSFTLAPAVRTWRQDLLAYLKAGERGIVRGRSRATRSLVVLQLALAVVLLTSAGLAYRSLSLIDNTDLGFPTEHLLLVTVDAGAVAPTAEARVPLLEALLAEIETIPGIRAASYARREPWTSWPTAQVRARQGADPIRAEQNEVGPGYLRTLGVTTLSGQEFDRIAGAPGGSHAVINQRLADALWPGEPALGRTMRTGTQDREAVVVGVLPNALIGGYRRGPTPYISLLSARQAPGLGNDTTFYIRYSGTLDALVPLVTRAVREAAPGVPVARVRTIEADLSEMTWLYRTLTNLLLMFAAGSLFIAAFGQYGAMAFAMRQRLRDYAIRMAMGASSRDILTSAIREGLVLTGIGLTMGIALGIVAGRSGRSLLHGISPTDAATYAGVLAVLGVASLAACYVPARRASRVDPIEALRAE